MVLLTEFLLLVRKRLKRSDTLTVRNDTPLTIKIVFVLVLQELSQKCQTLQRFRLIYVHLYGLYKSARVFRSEYRNVYLHTYFTFRSKNQTIFGTINKIDFITS